jgi:thiamine-phosphate pyrophosphorylase
MLSTLDAALQDGALVVQYRAKDLDRGPLYERASQVQQLCAARGALFIVNDAADVAALLEADGLHLGQSDLPPALARRLVGPDMLIGLSVSAVEEARRAAADPNVDYLGVGAMYSTETKADAEYGGPELLRAVRAAVDLPLVAIGGITVDNAAQVWEAGADLLAVVTAVSRAQDPAGAVAALIEAGRPRPVR